MTHPFPLPPIVPIERLQVSNGLLINAERWHQAHEYHRQRQNTHYQCLNQPGIVCGLGIRVIAAPSKVDAQYRDKRWVQVQPGIAIDLVGNLIVVPQSIDFRVATEAAEDSDPIIVYLVISYVDPSELRLDGKSENVQETFRIDEKSSIPGSSEVELCRILLQPGKTAVTQPSDVFFPGYNHIDLRYRTQAQARPQAIVRMAQVNHNDPECARSFFNLSYLLQAVEALYPALQGAGEVGQVTLEPEDEVVEVDAYDLLYLTGKQALSLTDRDLIALRNYLEAGGVLLVDAPIEATTLVESIAALAHQLGYILEPLEKLRRDHPLRTHPFLFAALPILNKKSIQLSIGGGIVLVVGDLAAAWGPDKGMTLTRATIRSAQELGINILRYAWRRRQLLGLQQEDYSGQW
jgi:Domain of unknown function (DUF4159)